MSYDPLSGQMPTFPGTASSGEEFQTQVDQWRRWQRAAAGTPDLPPSLIAAIQPGVEKDNWTASDMALILSEASKSWDPTYGMASLGYSSLSALGSPVVSVSPQQLVADYVGTPYAPRDVALPYVPPITPPGPPDAYPPPDPTGLEIPYVHPPPLEARAFTPLQFWPIDNAVETAAPYIEPMFQLKVGDVVNPDIYPALPSVDSGGNYPGGPVALPGSPYFSGASYLPTGGYSNNGLGYSNSGINLGGAVTAVGGAVCDYAPEGPLRTACLVANGLLAEALGGQSKGTNLGAITSCPQGYTQDSSGRCVQSGLGGLAARVIPGGSSGALTSSYGAAVMGAFGIPALQPAQVGTITRNDGSSGPILRCPAGMVLGKDQLCYMKGSIPRGARKNPPQPRPLLSAADGRVLNRAKAVEKRVRSVYSKHAKKPCRCGTARKKK